MGAGSTHALLKCAILAAAETTASRSIGRRVRLHCQDVPALERSHFLSNASVLTKRRPRATRTAHGIESGRTGRCVDGVDDEVERTVRVRIRFARPSGDWWKWTDSERHPRGEDEDGGRARTWQAARSGRRSRRRWIRRWPAPCRPRDRGHRSACHHRYLCRPREAWARSSLALNLPVGGVRMGADDP